MQARTQLETIQPDRFLEETVDLPHIVHGSFGPSFFGNDPLDFFT